MKFFQPIKLFADTDKFDGLSGNGFDAQGSTATGVAVHLAQDNAVKLELIIKLLGGVDGILAGHGITNQVYLMRVYSLDNIPQLSHEACIDVQTPSGIKDYYIPVSSGSPIDGSPADSYGIFAAPIAIGWYVNLLGQNLQLVHSGRSLQIRSNQ
jgi:hypothetical protein